MELAIGLAIGLVAGTWVGYYVGRFIEGMDWAKSMTALLREMEQSLNPGLDKTNQLH